MFYVPKKKQRILIGSSFSFFPQSKTLNFALVFFLHFFFAFFCRLRCFRWECSSWLKCSLSLLNSFHLGLKSRPCRKWDGVQTLTLAVLTGKPPVVHSVSWHLRATEQHALLYMSELCGPLKPRGPGLPIKMSWKLHFPISSGFGWRLCDVNPKE